MIAPLIAVLLQWQLVGDLASLGGSRIYCKIAGQNIPVATLDVGKQISWNADNFLVGQPEGRNLEFYVMAYNTEFAAGKPSNTVSYTVTHPPTQMSVTVPVSAPKLEGYTFEKWKAITNPQTGEITLEATYKSK